MVSCKLHYHTKNIRMHRSKSWYCVYITCNSIIIKLSMTSTFHFLFPFFKNLTTTKKHVLMRWLLKSLLHIQCESKEVAPPQNFLRYFHLWWTCATENYCGYCPNIFLCLHQFWSIYLNIYINCIIFASKTPQILTVQFRLLQNW